MSVLGRIWSQAKRSLRAAPLATSEPTGFASQAHAAEQAGDAAAASALFARLRAAGLPDAEAYWRIGRTLGRAGRLEEARRALQAARGLDPSLGDVDADLGNVAALAGELEEAERAYRAALARHPGHPGILANLGHLLRVRRMPAAARAAFAQALQNDPQCVPALKGLASLAAGAADLDVLARARGRAPDCAAACAAHATALLIVARDAAGALEQFDLARHLGLDDAELHGGRALALVALGRTAESLPEFDSALARDPGNGQWRWHRSLALLALGRYAEAWDDYEMRLRSEDRPQRDFGLPRWVGEELSGKTILVHAEQGLGDEIMFASCLPELIAQARRCIVECHPKLVPLYRRSFPSALIHGGTQFEDSTWLAALGPVALQVPIGSLPLYLRRTGEAFPSRERYLLAEPARVQRWRERLAALGARSAIGLSWQGGSADTGRERRSVSLDELRPLLEAPQVHWVSLQYDARAEEIEAFARRAGVALTHWPEAIADYEETAALLCALDLTVSVCTSLVHLGGALGCPLWVLTPFAPEWRFGTSGEAMPWHPSLRLFRQQEAGEGWRQVLARMRGALDARAAA